MTFFIVLAINKQVRRELKEVIGEKEETDRHRATLPVGFQFPKKKTTVNQAKSQQPAGSKPFCKFSVIHKLCKQ